MTGFLERNEVVMEYTEFYTSFVDIISNVGFPIFVSLYLLQRMETKLDEMVQALQDLSQTFKENI